MPLPAKPHPLLLHRAAKQLLLACAVAAIATICPRSALAQEPPLPEVFQHPVDSLAASPRLGEVMAALHEVGSVRTAVEMEKSIQGLRRPLRSQGRLLFVRDRGLHWAMERPLTSELLVTADRVATRRDPGKPFTPVSGGTGGAQGAQNFAVLLSLLGGDMAELERSFSLHFREETSGWSIGLLPREGSAARAIRYIVLGGGSAWLHTLTVSESNGDRSRFAFDNPRLNPSLTDEELALFQ